ncbi:hypothetical protein Pmi06nite_58780 [Planotetraspora mira]|uniref:Luciferase-like domain-containing protein n=1 Tax=Planotetraspora mira TaxID=58121 RepID=A0A8J3X9H8_9ACTN|nr:hypothetical protein Pmi06nite_58780 [Planotetraspora mira]
MFVGENRRKSQNGSVVPLDAPSAAPEKRLPLLSLLELAVLEEGHSARDGLAAVVATARGAADLGFRRVWVAEHHGYSPVSSVAPPVLAAHLAAVTERIRVGSGGVLLPNHAPLAVAEQFMTMAALHPERIDLGVGRGPGTFDPDIMRALRRGADPATDVEYRADLAELLSHLGGGDGARVLPGADVLPEPWLLSSSAAGAELAAELGLPLAFAYHIRPGNAVEALTRYREKFRPSRWRDEPYVLVSVDTVCGATDAEAAHLVRPAYLALLTAFAGRAAEAVLCSPAEAAATPLHAEAAERLEQLSAAQAQGSPETVRRRLAAVATLTGADELMLSIPVYDPSVRLRTLEAASAVVPAV